MLGEVLGDEVHSVRPPHSMLCEKASMSLVKPNRKGCSHTSGGIVTWAKVVEEKIRAELRPRRARACGVRGWELSTWVHVSGQRC